MARRNVVVFAPAPIAVGEELEVHLMNVDGAKAVAVRDLKTGILYGGGAIFSEAAKEEDVDGRHKSDFRTSRPSRLSRVESVYRGRVVECVIANVAQTEGHAACTSFVVEVAATPTTAYRT
jgi:hypothetical protein